jgi:hypothetical protein
MHSCCSWLAVEIAFLSHSTFYCCRVQLIAREACWWDVLMCVDFFFDWPSFLIAIASVVKRLYFHRCVHCVACFRTCAHLPAKIGEAVQSSVNTSASIKWLNVYLGHVLMFTFTNYLLNYYLIVVIIYFMKYLRYNLRSEKNFP